MAGITEKVRSLIDEGLGDRDEITERILSDTSLEEMVEMIRPVLAWQVGNTMRSFTRSSEQRTFKTATRKSPSEKVLTVVDELRNLIGSSFVLEDGERVTWGEATVDQHQRRASMLRAHSDRVLETAARHEKAAQMIAEASATCLADLLDEPHAQRNTKKKAA